MQKRFSAISRRVKFSQLQQFSLCFIFGLALGALFAAGSDSYLYSLMRQCACRPMSIVTSLILAVFPFLILAYGAWIHRKEILLWMAFLSAFSYGFFGCLLLGAFGSAGWLLQILIQFTQSASLPMLCWFSLRQLEGKQESLLRDHIICIITVSALALFDLFVVSPFVAELIEIYLGR